MSGDRPNSQVTENENLKPGSPPRPATEPKGSEGSSKSPKTATDPATGEPNHSGSTSLQAKKNGRRIAPATALYISDPRLS